jgi:hypothetical protein
MVQPLDAEKIILKTKQYEFSDGLRDIQIGLTLILIGLFWGWLSYQPAWLRFIIGLGEDYGRWATITASSLLMLFPILAAFGLNKIMEILRRRWLWRESGIVKSSSILVPARVNIISIIIFLALVGLGILLQPYLKTGDLYMWSVILFAIGWSFGFILIGVGRSLQLQRYIIMGAVGSIASTGTFFYQTSLSGSGLVFYLGWGLILLVGGFIVLKRVWPHIKEDANAG